jgi:hypothetical protein
LIGHLVDPILRHPAQAGQKISGGNMETQSKTIRAAIFAIVMTAGAASAQQAPSPPPNDALWTTDRT